MTLHLVRHPPVSKHWQKRCYGRSDPGFSRAGIAMIPVLIDRLTALKPDIVIHSDLTRTRLIAEKLARQLHITVIAEPLWRERNFGTWEGQTWNAIYRASGNAMDGMLSAPDTFRPGGGETTSDLVKRIEAALKLVPDTGNIVVITHGGAIAAARLIMNNLPADQLAGQIPQLGEVIALPARIML